jgi:hypothetical protein
MTDAETQALLSTELRDWVAMHRDENPQTLAFQRHNLSFPQALAVGQVALLQKAASKLPQMAVAQCILTQRAFEQSTSESLSRSKPWGKGATALDLTCGLGSDSYAMAAHYTQVTSLEPNPNLAAIVRFNANLLGIKGIDLRNETAEDFLAHYDGPPFDLVYADPDRRDTTGKRVFGLQDCQPNVVELLPRLRQIGKRILIKGSPMLDIAAVQKLFPDGASIWVLSEGNECKEILIEPDVPASGVGAILIRKGQSLSILPTAKRAFYPTLDFAERPTYIFEGDVALYKAGLFDSFMEHVELRGGMLSPDGYYFSHDDDPDFHGHRFRVLDEWPYKPQAIKSALKARGISKIQYSRRDFDLPMAEVRKQIALPEGGELFLLLTRYGTRGRWAFLAERLV